MRTKLNNVCGLAILTSDCFYFLYHTNNHKTQFLIFKGKLVLRLKISYQPRLISRPGIKLLTKLKQR